VRALLGEAWAAFATAAIRAVHPVTVESVTNVVALTSGKHGAEHWLAHAQALGLFALKVGTDQHRTEESITEVVTPLQTLDLTYQKQLLPGREREFTPLHNHVYEVLRGPLREYLPDDNAYDDAFDMFEYLLGLIYCHAASSDEGLKQVGQPGFSIRGPIGRFVWKSRTSEHHIQQRTHFEQGGPYPEFIDAVVRAGLFGPVWSWRP
jgi:hypothetical protein